MPAGEEAELVLAAQQGDKGAFAALLERHRPMLLAVCGRPLRDRWLAEDAVQEAAVQALLSLDRLRRPESFAPWLSAIGLNICRGWLRERRHAWSWDALVGGQIVDAPHTEPEPEDLAEATELAERVRQAVSRLPRRQRAAVLLFYLASLSQIETAALLGIPVSAVKTRLHKARQKLKEELRPVWREQT